MGKITTWTLEKYPSANIPRETNSLFFVQKNQIQRIHHAETTIFIIPFSLVVRTGSHLPDGDPTARRRAVGQPLH